MTRTWLLDGNVLVALAIDTHAHHQKAHAWFASLGKDRFATCSVTEGTLLRMHMMFAGNRTAAAAWQALERIREHPKHVFWEGGFSYAGVRHDRIAGHRQVTDAWLAELARKRRGRMATFDGALASLHPEVIVRI
ncbi:MAG: VapC toxin family PIN domain ribonuclease [Deltaproteobacteria bacterium]|nr:VapC toxin family PIN domain ribonuclease [Deltaproteobacteria bacterium]